MASRQVKWAQNKRSWMIRILGGKCARCQTTECLTFDCIRPQGGKHHRLSSVGRMTFYAQQMRMGNLQLLCSACNSKKGAREQPRYIVKPGSSAAAREADRGRDGGAAEAGSAAASEDPERSGGLERAASTPDEHAGEECPRTAKRSLPPFSPAERPSGQERCCEDRKEVPQIIPIGFADLEVAEEVPIHSAGSRA